MFWNNAVTSCHPRLFRASQFPQQNKPNWRPKRRFVKFDQKLIQERLLLVQVGNVFVDIFLRAISRAIQNVIQLRKEKRMRDQHSITNTREWMICMARPKQAKARGKHLHSLLENMKKTTSKVQRAEVRKTASYSEHPFV